MGDSSRDQGGEERWHVFASVCVFVWWGSRGAAGTQWGASALEAVEWDHEGLHTRHRGEETRHNGELEIKRQIPKAKKEATREGAAPEQR